MKALGFDLGETLVGYQGTKLSWREHYPKVLREVALTCDLDPSEPFIERASEELAKFNTRENPRIDEVPSTVIFERVLAVWPVSSSRFIDKSIETFFQYFQRRAKPYEDTFISLKKLKAHGFRIGILTDVPYGMPSVIARHDIKTFQSEIDVFLTSIDVGHRKPHASGFQLLADQLGIPADKLTYIGNEKKDIDGPKSVGAQSILISRDRTQHDWQQDHTVFDLKELVSYACT